MKLSQNYFVPSWLYFMILTDHYKQTCSASKPNSQTTWTLLKVLQESRQRSCDKNLNQKNLSPLLRQILAQDFFLRWLPDSNKQSSSSASPQILESSQPTKYNLLCNKQKTLGLAAFRIYFTGDLQVNWDTISIPLWIFSKVSSLLSMKPYSWLTKQNSNSGIHLDSVVHVLHREIPSLPAAGVQHICQCPTSLVHEWDCQSDLPDHLLYLPPTDYPLSFIIHINSNIINGISNNINDNKPRDATPL